MRDAPYRYCFVHKSGTPHAKAHRVKRIPGSAPDSDISMSPRPACGTHVDTCSLEFDDSTCGYDLCRKCFPDGEPS